MRKFILQQLIEQGLTVTETALTKEDLLNADEVFLSNSIYNIRWVAAIENKTYTNSTVKKIFNLLTKTNAAVFC